MSSGPARRANDKTRSVAASQLIADIEEAFRHVPYPGDGRIVAAPHSPEPAEIAEVFRGRDWRDLSVAFLFHYHASLSCFTPEAFRYYLPAYLLAIIRNFDEADILSVKVMYDLTPPSEAHYNPDFSERTSVLAEREREVVASFVAFFLDEHGDEVFYEDGIRLKGYWCS